MEEHASADKQPRRDSLTADELDEMISMSRLERPILTLETMRGVRELDTLGGDMNRPDVVSAEVTTAIGVFASIKPAGIVGLEELEYAGVNCEQFAGAIDMMGLQSVMAAGLDGSLLLMISRHKELAEELRAMLPENNTNLANEQYQYKMGALLGYPVTSTEYFLKRVRTYEETGEWPEYPNRPYMTAYSQLIFSPDHFEEELASYSLPLEEAVKVIAPQTYLRNKKSYNQITESHKQGRMANILRKFRRE